MIDAVDVKLTPLVEAAARKALMVANSRYHSWPDKRREQFRATLDKKTRLRIKRVLLKELCNIECCHDDVEDIWYAQTDSDSRYALDWAEALTACIGHCNIAFQSDYLPQGKSFLDFPTLYDYDIAVHNEQEQLRLESASDFPTQEYRPFNFPLKFLRPQRDRLFPGTIQSLEWFMYSGLDRAAFDIVQSLIPNTVIEGKDHGLTTPYGVVFDLERESGGMEGQLEALEARSDDYIKKQCTHLREEFETQAASVYCFARGEGRAAHMFFVFNNTEALRRVRWRNFSEDCWAIPGNFEEIYARLEQEKEKLEAFLVDAHADIIRNYDPAVVKFQRQNRVFLSSQAADSLSEILGDETPE